MIAIALLIFCQAYVPFNRSIDRLLAERHFTVCRDGQTFQNTGVLAGGNEASTVLRWILCNDCCVLCSSLAKKSLQLRNPLLIRLNSLNGDTALGLSASLYIGTKSMLHRSEQQTQNRLSQGG